MVTEYQPSQRRQFMKTDAEALVETSLEDLGDMLEITFDSAEVDSTAKSPPTASSSSATAVSDNHEGHEHVQENANGTNFYQKDAQLLDMDFVESTPMYNGAATNVDIFASMTISSRISDTKDDISKPFASSSASVEFDNLGPGDNASAVAPSPPAPPAAAPNKRLASNIQRFLQQSQNKKD